MHGITITVAPTESSRLKSLFPEYQIRVIGFLLRVNTAKMIGGIDIYGSATITNIQENLLFIISSKNNYL